MKKGRSGMGFYAVCGYICALIMPISLCLLFSCCGDAKSPAQSGGSEYGETALCVPPESLTDIHSSSPSETGPGIAADTGDDTTSFKPSTLTGTEVTEDGTQDTASAAKDETTAAPKQTDTVTRAPVTTAPPHEHSYVCTGETSATCLEVGTKVYTCSCGETYTEYTDRLPHDFAGATCTSSAVCKNCGTADENSAPLGHDMVGDTCHRCGMKIITLGITADELKACFGKPSAVYEENTSAGAVESLVYDSDKKSVKIFEVCGNKVCGAFVCGAPCSFLCENYMIAPESSSEASEAENGTYLLENEVMRVHIYRDTVEENDIVACWGRLKGFAYGLDTVSTLRERSGRTVADYSVQERLCLEVVNCFRAMKGLGALAYSDGAAVAALVHSIDMAENEYFAHEDANGVRVGGRLDACGIPEWTKCGENIFAGFEIFDSRITGSGLVAAYEWYVSPEHRHVMLSDSYTFSGVGIAVNKGSDYRYYYTQVFYTDAQ